MVKSAATSVDAYLAELPPERRELIEPVLAFARKHVPKGYVEGMSWGMIVWEIPFSRYPITYNKQPLTYAALAAQKNYNALYLPVTEQGSAEDAMLRSAYAKAGIKLDMGLCCLRFKRLDQLLWEPIAKVLAGTSVDAYIVRYEKARVKK